MLEIPVKNLCRIGEGKRIHIRNNYMTERMFCGLGGWDRTFVPLKDDIYSLTEFHHDLCKICLREYRRLQDETSMSKSPLEIVREKLKERGLPESSLKTHDIWVENINFMSWETALKLSEFLGEMPDFWMAVQTDFLQWPIRKGQ